MIRYARPLVILIGVLSLAAGPAIASWDDWNCNLQVRWGAPDGSPNDRNSFLGVRAEATDGYDAGLDARKPSEPFGDYVYAWFERPAWGQGRIMHDWRAPIAEGASKRWGTSSITDTWNVKTNLDNGPSGYFDPTCDIFNELEYPIAASIYITWEFGVGDEPPLPRPPTDYTFTLIYRGGINPKPPGTAPAGPTVPAMDTTWDMEDVDHVWIPLWNGQFQPWRTDCAGFEAADMAKFFILVSNPETPPSCTIAVSPDPPQRPPATFTFTAVAIGDEPFSFDWDFGDGAIGAGSPVSHSYPDVGVFEVTCLATDIHGHTCTCAAAVEVAGPPIMPPTCHVVYYPATPTTDDLMTFYANASDPDGVVVSVNWQFGDGGTSSGDPRVHQYATPGSYAVSVQVCDNDGACTTCTAVVSVDQPPTCHITYTPYSPRIAEVVTFDSHAEPAAGLASVSWDFGDGTTGAGWQVTHAYARYRDTAYTVTCTVVDHDGRVGRCQAAISVQMAFSLQWALDRLGYTVNVPVYYSGQVIEPKGYRQSTESDAIEAAAFLAAGPVQATLQARSSGLEGTFGYFQANRIPLLWMPEWEWWIRPNGPSCWFAPSGSFGLYLEAGGWVFAADAGWPPDGFDYFMLFPARTGGVWVGDEISGRWQGATTIPDTYICAWEDWKDAGIGGDADFQDVIIRLSGVQVTPGPAGSVYGQVRSAWNSQPLNTADVSVRLFSDAVWNVRTDAEGWYRIDRVPPGARVLGCIAPGFQPCQTTIDVPTGQSLRRDIFLLPTCRVRYLPANPTTDDAITFEVTVTPLAGPIVSATWQFGDGETAAGNPVAHQYALPGTYAVSVSACGQSGLCTTCSANVTVGKGVNIPPLCEITYQPGDPHTGEEVTFHANAVDPNPWGVIVSYHWDFGDGGAGSGDPAAHVYADAGDYTVCVTVTDDQGGQATCCTQVSVALPCECDLVIDRTHCKMPAAGHVGQCKIGQIGARNASTTEPCDVVMRVTDNAGAIVFEATQTIGPGRRIRLRFAHCYTAAEVGKNLWTWEVQPVGCRERTPWNNARLAPVNVHP